MRFIDRWRSIAWRLGVVAWWCSIAGKRRLVAWRWCSVAGKLRLVAWRWCSVAGKLRLVAWRWSSVAGLIVRSCVASRNRAIIGLLWLVRCWLLRIRVVRLVRRWLFRVSRFLVYGLLRVRR